MDAGPVNQSSRSSSDTNPPKKELETKENCPETITGAMLFFFKDLTRFLQISSERKEKQTGRLTIDCYGTPECREATFTMGPA